MSVAPTTRSQKDKGVPEHRLSGDKDSKDGESIQTESNTEHLDPSPTVSGNQEKVDSKAVKGIRFKRRAARGMITRYTNATKKLMEQRSSRVAIRQNMYDILEKFREIEVLHAQLEEHLEQDEGIIADVLILADIRLEVNYITGITQEPLEERVNESNTGTNSEISSRRSSPPPLLQVENNDLQDELDKQKKEDREAEQQKKQEAARLAESARQKRAEAARLEEEANEAER